MLKWKKRFLSQVLGPSFAALGLGLIFTFAVLAAPFLLRLWLVDMGRDMMNPEEVQDAGA